LTPPLFTMPQLLDFLVLAEAQSTGLLDSFGIQAWTLVAQTINFLLVFALIYFFAVKPIMATLDERQKKIADGLQFAEDARVRLEEVEKQGAETLRKASVEAQALIQEARDNAKSILERETRAATEKAQALIAKAEEAIALEREQMLTEVRQEVTRLVVETTRKVLRRDLSDEDRTRFSEAAARELSSTGN
jgi:F-type H+-transporting ATPase subunit b